MERRNDREKETKSSPYLDIFWEGKGTAHEIPLEKNTGQLGEKRIGEKEPTSKRKEKEKVWNPYQIEKPQPTHII